MSIRSSKLVAVFVELLFFAAIQQMARQDAVASPPGQPQVRTWTDHTGKYRTEAAFVESKDGKVTLRKKDGTVLNVPLEKLSDADQQYVNLSSQKVAVLDAVGAPAGIAPKKSPTKKAPAWNIFTNKSTGEILKGKILDRREKQGAWFFLVEDENGQRGWLRANWFVISKAPETDRPQATETPGSGGSESPGSKPGSPAVGVNPPVVEEPGSAPLPAGKEVFVTGDGADPEKALQNAFSQAIEQTVGLLVDSETVVKNDQLIRDKVLTYSRGYVEKYDVVKQWKEDGLYHAAICAVVARDRLTEKLRAIKIAMVEVPGDLKARQFVFDIENEKRAAAMFKKALADFDMTKLTKAEIVGEPEITRDGTNAKMRIKVKVSPDLGQWKTFSQNLHAVLTRVSSRRADVSVASSGLTCGFTLPNDMETKALQQRLKGKAVPWRNGDDILVSVLVAFSNPSGSQAQWVAYRVPETISAAIQDVARKKYRVTYKLFDDDGHTVSVVYAPIEDHSFHTTRVPVEDHSPLVGFIPWSEGHWWWMGPIWFRGYPDWITFYEDEQTVSLSLQDLRKVRKTAVFVEEDTRDVGHSRARDPFAPGG